MTRSAPPRFVPTLTEIVHQQLPPQTSAVVDAVTSVAHSPEAMVQRILQSVDQMLETRLRDSVRHLVLKQTQALLPLLSEEIERVVRESVSQAFEQESGKAQLREEDPGRK